jgi:hypothetical protein
MVAAGIIEAELDSIFAGMGNVLGQPVGHADHLAGGDTVDRLTVTEIAFVLVLGALPGRVSAVDFLNLHPVDRITLRQPGVAVGNEDRLAMGGIRSVIDGVARHPHPA